MWTMQFFWWVNHRRTYNRIFGGDGSFIAATMIKNIIAKILRTPKYKQRKVESKKKYKRKKKVSGYYYDYDGKEQILYDDN